MLVHSSTNHEQRRVGLVTYAMLLPHMSALFITSLIQTAGHKKAALTVVFSRLSNMDFKK